MNPAFSVIFLTTLIGVGQGFFLALYTGDVYSVVKVLPSQDDQAFYGLGSLVSLVFLIAGLLASFFHLGHPERAWRAATQWRTSWLSREVIMLPVFMFIVALYGGVRYFGWDQELATLGAVTIRLSLVIGFAGMIACLLLFLCTGMIYGCIKFIQEWSTPLTVINYTLLGSASGLTLSALFAAYIESNLMQFLALWAIIFTVFAFITRSISLLRNARLRYKSSAQTAIGVRHANIQQKAQGFMGGSFNTREFFHHKSRQFLRSTKWIFILMVFPLPIVLLVAGLEFGSVHLLLVAFLVQYTGLIAERWYFFAQANHPQNIYYQSIA